MTCLRKSQGLWEAKFSIPCSVLPFWSPKMRVYLGMSQKKLVIPQNVCRVFVWVNPAVHFMKGVTQILARRRPHPAGFSLVELLVVILIIATLVAIAVPNIPYVLGYATDAKAQRNAQQLVSVFNSAAAAGAYRETGYPSNLEELIEGLQQGVTAGSYMPDVEFSIPYFPESEVVEVAQFLEYQPEEGRLSLTRAP